MAGFRLLKHHLSKTMFFSSLRSSYISPVFHKYEQQQLMAARSLVSNQRFCSNTQNTDSMTDDGTLPAQMKSSQ
jgi:hypothetical protein